ncbi:hypothetical protein Rvan_3272 [Rhodomicrobium vannielii ATCC 17100]|uniref:Uncharacterized protein n=1 Tax=Rhodomicrobium vannielii (strain ATCC 17100 / DSM 162 / LMG 4299 / NCIMB 10020 / ATH 3.1.1) TaxID=648757 RepID=E3I278_RHOVT|nr:hypothetical protein [Rhodomicrobium vannielii]ADP72465.1 hypothetical protein Rvan_3272 [Rhodomicrobium vannielii ATCC 17100]
MNQLKSYTVAMIMWETWNICVDAASEDEAKAQARASYERHGREEFSCQASGVDGFEIIDEQEADE